MKNNKDSTKLFFINARLGGKKRRREKKKKKGEFLIEYNVSLSHVSYVHITPVTSLELFIRGQIKI
jgi:hypothetical protein